MTDDDPITRALASLDRHRRDILAQYAIGMAACALLAAIGVTKLIEALL